MTPVAGRSCTGVGLITNELLDKFCIACGSNWVLLVGLIKRQAVCASWAMLSDSVTPRRLYALHGTAYHCCAETSAVFCHHVLCCVQVPWRVLWVLL